MTNGEDDDRTGRMARRFATAEDGENDDTDENGTNGGVAQDSTDDEDDEPAVRDTVGRTLYVGRETLDDVDRLHKQLDLRYDDEYGEDLPKNKVYYPALLRVAVNNPDQVADALGLEDDSDDEEE